MFRLSLNRLSPKGLCVTVFGEGGGGSGPYPELDQERMVPLKFLGDF